MSGTLTTQFGYDADGRRVMQTLPDGTKVVYVGGIEVTLTGTQRITKTYYSAGAKLIAMRVMTGVVSALYFVHTDHLGSVSLTTDGAGAVVSEQKYTAWGVVRSATGAMPTDVGYTGQRADTTGLMFYGARYYDASLARFISADSIVPGAGNPQALNRYAYVSNNPMKYVDPSGHAQTCDDDSCGEPGTCASDPNCYTPPPVGTPVPPSPTNNSPLGQPVPTSTPTPGERPDQSTPQARGAQSPYGAPGVRPYDPSTRYGTLAVGRYVNANGYLAGGTFSEIYIYDSYGNFVYYLVPAVGPALGANVGTGFTFQVTNARDVNQVMNAAQEYLGGSTAGGPISVGGDYIYGSNGTTAFEGLAFMVGLVRALPLRYIGIVVRPTGTL